MGRQEFIERRPRTEAEQPPEFWPGQMTGLVFFERQCFERAALEIGNGAEALDEVVGDSDSDIHADNVSPRGLPVHHLPARRAVIRAHNIVSADYFSGLGDRLTPAAVIPMHTPEEAIAELEFVTKPLGSKVGMFGSNMARKVPAAAANDPDTARLRCGTTCSASTDPVWKKCFELGITPTFHSASSNQGLRLSPTNFTYNHIGHFAAQPHRPFRRGRACDRQGNLFGRCEAAVSGIAFCLSRRRRRRSDRALGAAQYGGLGTHAPGQARPRQTDEPGREIRL